MVKRITIKDIAKELNMHHSTVSRALRDDVRVKEKTRKMVAIYAKKHGYQINMSALQLRGSVKNVIALIVPNISHNFFSNIVSLITNMAITKGYIVSVFQSNENYEQEKVIVDTIIKHDVAGVLASVTMETYNAEHFAKLKQFKIPLVFFDRVCDDINVSKVVVNNAEIVFDAVELLISKGCNRIAHIGGPQRVNVFKDRQNGYNRALDKNGIEYKKALLVDKGFTTEDGKNAIINLFNEKIKPDAIICDSNSLLVGVLLGLKKLNLSIPDDIQVIGYSDNPYLEVFRPGVISIIQPDEEIAHTAFELLLKKLDGENQNIIESITISAKIQSLQ